MGIPVDLVAICLRCLEKDPARRYATADDLASDLERFLADEPVEARPLGIGARWLRHAKHRPFMAAFSMLLFVVASYAAVAEFQRARAQQSALAAELARTRVQQTAVHVADYAAHQVADRMAVQFERYTAAMETVGSDPRVAFAIADPSLASEIFARLLAQPIAPNAAAFSTATLFGTNGIMRARAPFVAVDNRGRSYQFRDYFRGAEERARQGVRKAYVSRAYRSESDQNFEFGISFPVLDASGRWVDARRDRARRRRRRRRHRRVARPPRSRARPTRSRSEPDPHPAPSAQTR